VIRFDRSCSGSAIQYGTVGAVRHPGRLPEQGVGLRVSIHQIASVSLRAIVTAASGGPLVGMPAAHARGQLGVGRLADGVVGGLDQRPPQVAGPVLGERAAVLGLA
jgi:hypothetical protein